MTDYEWSGHLDAVRDCHRHPLAFAQHWSLLNAPLLERIRQAVRPPARLLEVGVGTGCLATLLSAQGYDVLGVDADATVVDGARDFAAKLGVSCRFEVADGFHLERYRGQFDLACSLGVIEHFSADQAVQLLRQQAASARKVLAMVPTWHSLKNDPLTGPSNARSIWRPELHRLFAEAGLLVEKTFGYGVPGGAFSVLYQYALPGAAQLWLQNRRSYACSIGCVGRVDQR